MIVRENLEILAPKDEEEIFSDLHNVSSEQMLNILEEEYMENWEEVVIDFVRYWGRDKFVKMFSEMILHRWKMK
jgi:predicted nucleotide-binding protein (sugar kinase/HSP70/actin superfamily)